jgi:hypothetical protein
LVDTVVAFSFFFVLAFLGAITAVAFFFFLAAATLLLSPPTTFLLAPDAEHSAKATPARQPYVRKDERHTHSTLHGFSADLEITSHK